MSERGVAGSVAVDREGSKVPVFRVGFYTFQRGGLLGVTGRSEALSFPRKMQNPGQKH